MKKYILIISSILLFISCCGGFEKLIKKMGFTYDGSQDIYVSRVDSWQRRMGYSAAIDLISTPVGMVIDCEPVTFNFNGKLYMIELWKGQYDLSTGAEIGIYTKSDSEIKTWNCGKDSEMLDMSYSLKKNGNELFKRNGRHWWLTGFMPGEFSNPEDLTMDISIDFSSHPEWKEPFRNSLRALGYGSNEIVVNGNTVKFIFDDPETEQPETSGTLRSQYQEANRSLVEEYNKAKTEADVKDNSPCSIDKMLKKSPELISYILKQNF